MNVNYLSKAKFFVISLLAFASFAACSQDELPEMIQEEGQSLKINISIAGFTSDSPETRTSDSVYTTRFTPDDKIGITVLSRRNEILQNNVAYKYADGAWTPAGGEKVTYYSGATYLVYYPYSATMDGKKTAAEILEAFTPENNQSSYSGYSASDLMTGTGTISGSTLNVSFAHALALMEVKLLAKYTLQGTTVVKIVPLINPDFSINNGQIPFYPVNDSVYRYIVKPNGTPITVSGTYSGISWSKQFTPQVGQYKRLNVDGATVTPSTTFAVGDYYPVADNPYLAMGVVYEISNDGTNGRAVSIDETYTTWDTNNGTGGVNEMKGSNTDKNDGALNTSIIKNLPVFSLAKAKNGGGTSPWYIPASNELISMMDIIGNNRIIRLNINAAVGGKEFPEASASAPWIPSVGYWTSTRENKHVLIYSQYSVQSNTDVISTKGYVRAIMKF